MAKKEMNLVVPFYSSHKETKYFGVSVRVPAGC